MSIRPLGDRVLVKPLKEEEITKSGIVLPDTLDKEKKTEGEIIALGEGEKLAKLKELNTKFWIMITWLLSLSKSRVH